MAPDEILAVYDRVMIETLKKLYADDGIAAPKANLNDLLQRFARGVTTMIRPNFQNFKYQFWDRQRYFKPTFIFNDTAIVIQGPLVYENNYTAETFKLYRSIYPNVPIVVSTWQSEATNAFRRECQENSVVLLENEPPKDRGPWNVNMQLKSSFEGVKFVKENFSAKFVLKTRTDQRINRFDFLVYFKNLLKTFPPKDDKLQGRIILLDGSQWLPFRASDFLAFGYIADLFKFYGISPYCRGDDAFTYREKHRVRFDKIIKLIIGRKRYGYIPTTFNKKFQKFNKIIYRFTEAESYILKKFYVRYIGKVDNTEIIKLSWKFTQDYLLFIDISSILLDWPKYEYGGAYTFDRVLGLTNEMGFARWLDLYRNFKCDWI